jgi:choline kinase
MKKALILAAGMGSRLQKAHHSPKPLTLLNNEVSLLRLFRQFSEAGIEECGVVVGHRGSEIIKYVETNYKGSLKITFFDNQRYKEPNGVSLLTAKEFITERVLLSMADHMFMGSPIKTVTSLGSQGDECFLLIDKKIDTIFDIDDATKVLIDDDNFIIEIGKTIPEYNCIDTGLFGITPRLIHHLEKLESPSLSEGVKALSAEKLMKTVELTDGFWQDIDTPETLEYALKVLNSK